MKSAIATIYLSTPHLTGEEIPFIQEVLSADWKEGDNSSVALFETGIAQYLNKSYVTALNSGTSALHLGLILLGVGPGDEVLCQSMTFSASANPILYQAGVPVFVDSELDTWNLCPVALETAILDRLKKGKKPKAIVAVHSYGMPYKINEVHAIASKYGIPILEDAAEALGSTYQGIPCGSFGTMAVLSFNTNKIITTSGGGALVVSSKILKDKSLFYATQSRDDCDSYHHSEVGYNYRMSPLCAALGRGQLVVLPERLLKRKEVHEFYCALFMNIKEVTVLSVPHEDFISNYWLTTILCESSNLLSSLKLILEKEQIETRYLWRPLHLQPVFENYPYYGGTISAQLFDRGLCLPSGSTLSYSELSRIRNVIFNFFSYRTS